ncbi:MAG: hypothetical protein HRU41_06020 [Saprospiraceae bacterium]|nr:hypothetical protein [Saprospiraceae bacterium]
MNRISNKKIYQNQWTKIQYQMMADIEIGVPSKNCRNFGICHINPAPAFSGTVPQMQDRKALAILTVFSPKHLELDFLKQSMTTKTYVRFFSADYFLVEEDFTYSTTDDYVSFTISRGEYEIWENGSLIKVVIN